MELITEVIRRVILLLNKGSEFTMFLRLVRFNIRERLFIVNAALYINHVRNKLRFYANRNLSLVSLRFS